MKTLVAVALVVALLPVSLASAQGSCDGNFHVVHEYAGDGVFATDIAFSSPEDGWIVGSEYVDGSVRLRPLVIRFNGEAYSRLDNLPAGGRLEILAVAPLSPTDVWLVGRSGRYPSEETAVLHWDGATWKRVHAPTPGRSSGLSEVKAFAPDDIWAVGSWERRGAGTRYKTLLLHYDGTSWTRSPAPSPGRRLNDLFGIAGSSSTDIWAVGYAGVGPKPLALHWDGEGWTRVPGPPSRRSILYGVAAPDPNDVWVVGRRGFGSPWAIAYHYDGIQWTRHETPDHPGYETYLDVYTEGTQVWAAGFGFQNSPDRSSAIVDRWDGSAWSELAVARPEEGDIEGITGDGAGAVWAVNSLDPSGYVLIQRACTS